MSSTFTSCDPRTPESGERVRLRDVVRGHALDVVKISSDSNDGGRNGSRQRDCESRIRKKANGNKVREIE